jgi:periplasmic protein TonB
MRNMKPILIAIAFLTVFSVVKAQVKKKLPDTAGINADKFINDDWETRPSFPGGQKQFYKYMAKNIHYPASAVNSNTQGKVYLNFTIEKDGSIDNIKVVKGVSKDINAEAIRVLKSSPKWIPGTHHDKPIPFRYSIPMNFELPKKV